MEVSLDTPMDVSSFSLETPMIFNKIRRFPIMILGDSNVNIWVSNENMGSQKENLGLQ